MRELEAGKVQALLLVTFAALILIALVLIMALSLRMRKLMSRLDALTGGAGGDIEQTLTTHLEIVRTGERRMETLEQAVAILQAQMPACLRKTGLVRFDAFEDVGGEQSFSLALLDFNNNGFVLSSVYSRNDVRVYSKAIRDGRASHTLSQEEERALREAN